MAQPSRRRRRLVRSGAIVLVSVLLPALVLAVPTIEHPVTDEAMVLSPAQETMLSEQLVEYREQTGIQMAILTVTTTAGQPIEDFSIAVAQQWEGGHRERDDGLLLTLAIGDRASRLEVGYGLEPYVTDATAQSILDGMIPYLRAGDYAGGLAHAIRGCAEATSTIEPGDDLSLPPGSRIGPWFLTLLLIGFTVGAGFFAGVKRTGSNWTDTGKKGLQIVMYGVLPLLIVAFVGIDGTGWAYLVPYYAGVAIWPLGLKLKPFSFAFGLVALVTVIWCWDVVHIDPALNMAVIWFGVILVGGTGLVGGLFCLIVYADPSGSSSSYSSSSYSSSGYSSSSSSSSSYSSSSSSSSSSWSGGGGSFGGGGASSSW